MDGWGITWNFKSNEKTECISFAVPPISCAVTLGTIIWVYFYAVVIFKTELFYPHDKSVLYVSVLSCGGEQRGIWLPSDRATSKW